MENILIKKNEDIKYVQCFICQELYRRITPSHLKTHNYTMEEYYKEYNLGIGDTVSDELRINMSKSTSYIPYCKNELKIELFKLIKREDFFNLPGLQKEFPDLLGQITVEFGSFINALRVCGVDPEEYTRRVSWTKEKVLDEIKKMRKNESPLYARFIYLNYGVLLVEASNYFGTWGNALVSAGVPQIEASSSSTKNSPGRVLRKMSNFRFDYPGKDYTDILKAEAILYFGNLCKAKNELEVSKLNIGWTKEKVVFEYLEVGKKEDDVRPKILRVKYPKLYDSIKRLFHGVDNLKKHIGNQV